MKIKNGTKKNVYITFRPMGVMEITEEKKVISAMILRPNAIFDHDEMKVTEEGE